MLRRYRLDPLLATAVVSFSALMSYVPAYLWLNGAGRLMSRSRAQESITHKAMKDELRKHGVTLMGGGLDEAPFAYKDIDMVMQSQASLVDIVGRFTPRIVKMEG
jgi:tRNA-splicing ligase RtcB